MNGTSKNLIGVFKNNTSIRSIYKGNALVWEIHSSSSNLTGNIRGKLLDTATSTYFYLYDGGKNSSAYKKNLANYWTSLENKEFEYTLENTNSLAYLFYNNSRVEKIYEVPFTDSVTNSSNMFYGCTGLTVIDGIKDWNVSNVTDMSYMFYPCRNMTSFEGINKWNVKSVINMYLLFSGCSGISELDLSNWKIGSVRLGRMFYNCSNLITLNISNWNFSNVTEVVDMFYGCSKLCNIIGPISGINADFNISNSNLLSNDSAMVIINGLDTVSTTKKVTFGTNVKNSLSDELIAIATSKGWTIA